MISNSTLSVRGGNRLAGTVDTSGFKHALVATVAAALAADAPLTLTNCPRIAESRVLATLVTALGGAARLTGSTFTVDAREVSHGRLPASEAAKIHGSVYLLPALLGRFGAVELPPSGGCQIGNGPRGQRPIEHYLSIFERFGAEVSTTAAGNVEIVAQKLSACEVDLLDYTADRDLRTGPLYSGATKAALLTAAMAHGTSVLRAPYPKPDVTELVAVLRSFGVPITETAAGDLVVDGSGGLLPGGPARHELLPDLIEVVTWVCAGALLADEPLLITGPRMTDAATALAPERGVLDALGVRVEWSADSCVVFPAERLRPVDVLVASHGVFSDSQPLLALLASRAPGRSTITETVWAGRFTYAAGLATLGMAVDVSGQTMTVTGPWTPRPRESDVAAHDLRGAAALLIAALVAPGVTTLSGTHHLSRGYPDLPGQLVRLGAAITGGG